jgi:hypothetical protein
MMFSLFKLLSAITQPLFWLAVWWCLALVLLSRFRHFAASMLWGGLVVLGLLGFNALSEALLCSIESRFNVPSLTQGDQYVGVILLGGATGSPGIYKAHAQVPLGDSAERMTAPIALMRKFANFELIFSGGEGRLVPTGTSEAELARAFFAEQGVDMGRVSLKSRSGTTRENSQRDAAPLSVGGLQYCLPMTS